MTTHTLKNDTGAAHSKKAIRNKLAQAFLPPPAQGRGGNHFPDVELVSHSGETFNFYSDLIRDKVVMLHFMSLASQQAFPSLQHLSQVAKRLDGKLGKDVHLYSISIDPENDTPEKLAAYAAENRIPAGWRLLQPAGGGAKQITDRFGKHLSSHHHQDGVNLRMVHYGNGGVGLWGAFAAESNPDLAAARLGWVQNGSKAGPEVKRAGPARLESLDV